MTKKTPPADTPRQNPDVVGQFPLHLVLLFLLGLMLAGPVVFFAFLLGGSTAGFVALAVFAVAFVTIYIKGGSSGNAKP